MNLTMLSRHILSSFRNSAVRRTLGPKYFRVEPAPNSRQIVSQAKWLLHKTRTSVLARAYVYVGAYFAVFISGIYWTRPIYRYLTADGHRQNDVGYDDAEEFEDEPEYKNSEELFLQAQALKRISKVSATKTNTGGIDIVPKVKAMGNAPARDKKPASYLNVIADVVETVTPAVVYIEITGNAGFDGYTKGIPMSNGSGFIVRDDGLILTNAHVVANKQKVVVRLHSGEKYNGHVVAIDPNIDIALLKIDVKTKLPTMKLGDSSELRAGEWVIAIGSPLSLSNSVTAGVVSSVRPAQELGLKSTHTEYIQTDARITFGNSGGPLVNLNGEAIGINTMTVTAGISFAIPSNTTSKFLQGALAKEHKKGGWTSAGAARRYIGVTMLELTQNIMMEFKQKDPSFSDITGGILITQIVAGSPGHRGGLRIGDCITEINGKEIQFVRELQNQIQSSGTMTLTVRRRSATVKLKITPDDVVD